MRCLWAWDDGVALSVVMAAKGYPGTPTKGTEIRGLDQAAEEPRRDDLPRWNDARRRGAAGCQWRPGAQCHGARGASVAEARARAYAAIEKVDWLGGFCRSDIGWRAIAREQSRQLNSPLQLCW